MFSTIRARIYYGVGPEPWLSAIYAVDMQYRLEVKETESCDIWDEDEDDATLVKAEYKKPDLYTTSGHEK